MNRFIRRMIEVLALAIAMAVFLAGCGCQKDVTEVPKEEKGFTLALVQNTTGTALSCTLSKGQKKDEDHVRWVNQTTGPVEIKFTTRWPFLEENPSMTFTVPAGTSSPYYTLDTSKDSGAYDYTTNPTLVGSGGGHGEPTISVGD